MENNQTPQTKGNVGWAVLGFFIPLIGFILWLVWRNDNPANSKLAGKGALIGIIVNVALSILLFCISSCTVASVANDIYNNYPFLIN